jgi:frataxin-like iron-binding protein CyaY
MDFEIIAKKFLQDILLILEEMPDIEAELTDDGVLSIVANNGEYVINKHYITKQIWYSSPVSKLKYFIYSEDNFVDKNNPKLTLKEALLNDLKI